MVASVIGVSVAEDEPLMGAGLDSISMPFALNYLALTSVSCSMQQVGREAPCCSFCMVLGCDVLIWQELLVPYGPCLGTWENSH